MDILRSTEALDALEDLGSALETGGASIRRLVAIAREGAAPESAPSGEAQSSYDEEVALLLGRLGSENRKLLRVAAEEFPPGNTFTLEDVAALLGVSKASVRARIMNIGRSLKSLDSYAPVLWTSEWDGNANTYDWNSNVHRAILRMLTT